MKKARMNISHSRFLLKLKIFGEIVTTLAYSFLLFKSSLGFGLDFEFGLGLTLGLEFGLGLE